MKNMRRPKEIGEYLVVDPRVCHGKMTFKGTRVPVETVLTFLAKGDTPEEILAGWPELKWEWVAEAVRVARDTLVKKYMMSKSPGKPMSQLVLDDQLNVRQVFTAIHRWSKARVCAI